MHDRLVESYAQKFCGLSLAATLERACRIFPTEVALASSLGPEDQVLLDCAARHGLLTGPKPLQVFTLDTGRLFPETLELLAETERHYGIRIRVYYPDTAELEQLVAEGGIDLFRRSPEARHRCCEVRKVRPLQRALLGKRLWIVGLRAEQNPYRASIPQLSWDEANGLLKLSPLLDWSETEVFSYLDEHRVPRNALHARGYPSIGCAPCTRAVEAGEDPRAGRWWWERDSHRECGLHFENGRVVRDS